MNNYSFPDEGLAPDPSILLKVAAGWLALLAAVVGVTLGDTTGSSQVVGLQIVVGAAVAAVAFFLLARWLDGREQANVPLEHHSQVQSSSGLPKELDRVA